MLSVLLLVVGLGVLIVGADLLVRGASKLALALGIAPLVVGLTVVAFGTSAPELAVSLRGVYSGQTDIALGNVVGSNIANVLLILGLSALAAPLIVDRQVVRQEVPIMIGVSLLLWWLVQDGSIVRGEGVLLVALLVAYLGFLYWQSRRGQTPATVDEPAVSSASTWDRHWSVQVLLVVGGLVLLVLGARWFVGSAVEIARLLGVSELVIGLTIVAVGTSMPELVTSIVAALRGQRDIAVGNVVGSNIFNILGVLGLSAALAPDVLPVSSSLLRFDVPVMIAVAIACLPIFFTGHLIARWEGALFVGYYVAYTAWLVLYAQQHAALQGYALAMQWVVLPLTAITLSVVATRELRARRQPG